MSEDERIYPAGLPSQAARCLVHDSQIQSLERTTEKLTMSLESLSSTVNKAVNDIGKLEDKVGALSSQLDSLAKSLEGLKNLLIQVGWILVIVVVLALLGSKLLLAVLPHFLNLIK